MIKVKETSATVEIGRREFIKGSLAAVAAVSLCGNEAFAAAGPESRPNIVLINCDDLGYGDVACYGSKKIATPNLDTLAQNGLRFTDFYCTAPVCTPSRTALMTGRYPIRAGLTRVLGQYNKDGIKDEDTTIAQVLKAQGYATACIGKWHLGHLPQYLPTRHGFDYYYGIPYSNNMGAWTEGLVDVPIMRNEEVIERPAIQDTLTQRYTEETIKFIKDNKNGPFFVYLAHTMPHKPWHCSDSFRGRSKGGLYVDVIEELDWSVGEIVKTLREQGLDRHTIVMFTSDNGPNGGSAGPLRGGKTNVFEGGMRIPFIASWPGRIPVGLCREPANQMDLFPTFAYLAGGKPPKDRPLDGRDIRPLLTGKGKIPGAFEFYYFRTHVLQAMRYGNWKMHVGRDTNALPEPELYNLALDIGEKRDVAKQHPELVAELQQRIKDFRKGLPNTAKIGGSPFSY
ncbi:MAG: sulfatase [Armatimonadota bacterium]|nr:sulfatase [Armatimonadota bacterium]